MLLPFSNRKHLEFDRHHFRRTSVALQAVQRIRLTRRLLWHHFPILLILTTGMLWLYRSLPQKDIIWKASFTTAYPALLLLVATLVLGPWNVLRGQRMPVSSDLRRDLGIWAGILGVAHTIVGLDVHLRGRPWLYFIYAHPHRHLIPLRHDLFGFANGTGLVGTLILIVLLATSNDYSLRALGTPRWKQLQRWNYLAWLLVVLHGAAYQKIEGQRAPFVATLVACALVTLILQGWGYQRRRVHALQRMTAEKV